MFHDESSFLFVLVLRCNVKTTTSLLLNIYLTCEGLSSSQVKRLLGENGEIQLLGLKRVASTIDLRPRFVFLYGNNALHLEGLRDHNEISLQTDPQYAALSDDPVIHTE